MFTNTYAFVESIRSYIDCATLVSLLRTCKELRVNARLPSKSEYYLHLLNVQPRLVKYLLDRDNVIDFAEYCYTKKRINKDEIQLLAFALRKLVKSVDNGDYRKKYSFGSHNVFHLSLQFGFMLIADYMEYRNTHIYVCDSNVRYIEECVPADINFDYDCYDMCDTDLYYKFVLYTKSYAALSRPPKKLSWRDHKNFIKQLYCTPIIWDIINCAHKSIISRYNFVTKKRRNILFGHNLNIDDILTENDHKTIIDCHGDRSWFLLKPLIVEKYIEFNPYILSDYYAEYARFTYKSLLFYSYISDKPIPSDCVISVGIINHIIKILCIDHSNTTSDKILTDLLVNFIKLNQDNMINIINRLLSTYQHIQILRDILKSLNGVDIEDDDVMEYAKSLI